MNLTSSDSRTLACLLHVMRLVEVRILVLAEPRVSSSA